MSFNLLPMDAQLEILKHYPSYRSLSKPYYNEKQVFYNRYCNDPITLKEFFNYFKKRLQKYTVLFGVKDGDIHQENAIFLIDRTHDGYWVETIIISIHESDENEYTLYITTSWMHFSLEDLIYHIQDYDIEYDLVTMENILLSRPCELIKPGYAKAYLRKYINFNYIDDISTMNNAYNNIVDLLYLHANANQIMNRQTSIYSDVADYQFVFDGVGDLIDEVENYHEDIKPIYDESLDIILNYLG